MRRLPLLLLILLAVLLPGPAQSQDAEAWHEYIDERTEALYDEVVGWRRHFHRNPELSNREFDTAAYVAEYLRSLGMEVRTGIAHTGVVGLLEGGRPGPVVALRADMDALPVPSRTGLPFAPDTVSEFLGEEVPVSHACGHDTHMAMLMGVAQILADRREQMPGTVKFIFQPAEEGAPPGEEGGAKLMVEQGVLRDPEVDVIFGQHIWSPAPAGQIGFRSGGLLASADRFVVTVHGAQTHGSQPWNGIDPISVASQIVIGLNMIVSRQTELTREAAVISVGRFRAGNRNNIIPETAEMIGTIRALDEGMRAKLHEDIRRTVEHIAASQGATAEVEIQPYAPVTFNDPELTERMAPTLERVGGDRAVRVDAVTGAEDFAFFAREVPALYLMIGGRPEHLGPDEVAPHHTPDFMIEESAMKAGVHALANLAIDYMLAHED
ncbi:MAG: amidohydrolase [Wenzhouxiangellaceae bacterium]|nr:amidohydrolase [Wenzhouxiangellaceae bacterium]